MRSRCAVFTNGTRRSPRWRVGASRVLGRWGSRNQDTPVSRRRDRVLAIFSFLAQNHLFSNCLPIRNVFPKTQTAEESTGARLFRRSRVFASRAARAPHRHAHGDGFVLPTRHRTSQSLEGQHDASADGLCHARCSVNHREDGVACHSRSAGDEPGSERPRGRACVLQDASRSESAVQTVLPRGTLTLGR
jgi:hypothetical protein